MVDRESSVRIGHANKSETDLPNIQKDYIDCPGFGDTDPAKELQNAVYIQRVFLDFDSWITIGTEVRAIGSFGTVLLCT